VVARATTLEDVRDEAAACRRCPLWRDATQTVFGEGTPGAALMLLGEQPGDAEDRAGHPFVGPAGRLLDGALEAAGIDRDTVYVSNVVKHFKWQRMGKRRLHKKPNAAEVAACSLWWESELEIVAPRVLGLLGATAAQAVAGRSVRVTRDRGSWLELPNVPSSTSTMITIHPSAILRAGERREPELAHFVEDLQAMAQRAYAA
jgi:DNA polymerase